MRRTHNHNYMPVPSDAAENIEKENDEITEELKSKINTLKSLSIDIGNEVKQHDRLLRDIDDDFDKTGGFLGHTMTKVLGLRRGSHNYYICYLCLFAVFVFFILYIVIKLKS